MSEYLFAIQDTDGREVVAWKGEVERVSDVVADWSDSKTLHIIHQGDSVASGKADPTKKFRLHRWNADDKLAEPITKNVPRYRSPE